MNKKYLVLVVGYLIILVLIPLSFLLIKNTFLKTKTTPSKTYNLTAFNSKKAQRLEQKGQIVGKGIAGSKVTLILSPGGDKKEVTTDKEGIWTYTLPENLKKKKYNLTVLLKDKTGNLSSIKSYPVEIGLTQKVSHQKTNPLLTIAYAQTNQCSKQDKFCQKDQDCQDGTSACQNFFCLIGNPAGGFCQPLPQPTQPRELEALGASYNDWAARMHKLGIYPAKDIATGEIVFVSREEYESEICSNRRCTESPDFDKFINEVASNNYQYLTNLADELRKNCFIAADVMRSYFPDAEDFFDKEKYPSLKQILYDPYPNCSEKDIKHDIEETELAQHLVVAANHYVLDKEDPFRDLVIATDGFFSTGTIMKMFALTDGYQTNTGEVANMGFAVASIIPPAKAGGAVGKISSIGGKVISNRTVLKVRQLSPDIAVFRQAVSGGNRIPKQVVEDIIGNNLEYLPDTVFDIQVGVRPPSWGSRSNVLPPSRFEPGKLVPRGGSIPEPRIPSAVRYFNVSIKPAIEVGKGFALSRSDVLEPIAKNVERAIFSFKQRTGRNPPLRREFLRESIVEKGQAYVIEDSFMPSNLGAGFQSGDIIFLSQSRYESMRGLGSLHHEMVHMIGSGKKVGWTYGGPEELDRIFTAIYELMTDAWADLAMGQRIMSEGSHIATGGYAAKNPQIIDTLFNRLFKTNPDLLDDFLAFALDGDANKLIAKVVNNQNTTSLLQRILQRSSDPNLSRTDFTKFLAYFKQGKGVNWTAVVLSPAALDALHQNQADTAATIDPIVEFGDDFILDDYDKSLDEEELENEDIKITGVEGEIKPGATLDVSAIITSDGVTEQNPQDFSVTYTLQPVGPQTFHLIPTVLADEPIPKSINDVKALPENEGCLQDCEIQLPKDLAPGKYKLVALLHSKNSDKILDSDSEVITIAQASPSQTPQPTPGSSPKEESTQEAPETTLPPKTIIKITIGNKDYDWDQLQQDQEIDIDLDEFKNEDYNLPIVIYYTDNSTPTRLGYHFNLPPPPQSTTSEEQQPTQEPTPQEQTQPQQPQQPASPQQPAQTCITSCGEKNGENCTNHERANTECTDYWRDKNNDERDYICDWEEKGPQEDGCIPQ